MLIHKTYRPHLSNAGDARAVRSRQALRAAMLTLLEDKQYAEAERVYRDDLKKHPHNGWSLFGLKTALESQGRRSPEVEKDFEASWARSDTWVHASRF